MNEEITEKMKSSLEDIPSDSYWFWMRRKIIGCWVKCFGRGVKVWIYKTRNGEFFTEVIVPFYLEFVLSKEAKKNGRTVEEEIAFYLRSFIYKDSGQISEVLKLQDGQIALISKDPESKA
ncbi:MAG: hypothetical protein V4438_01745 [Patescibacteria group bacterium]